MLAFILTVFLQHAHCYKTTGYLPAGGFVNTTVILYCFTFIGTIPFVWIKIRITSFVANDKFKSFFYQS